MNIHNIHKTANYIETLQKGNFFYDGDEFRFSMCMVDGKDENGALRLGCIAGAIKNICPPNYKVSTIDTFQYAADYLGLDKKSANRLFFVNHNFFRWPGVTPQDAAIVLRNLAATGEVNWDIVKRPSRFSIMFSNFCDSFKAKAALATSIFR